jgi:hypothetical protein
VTGSGMRWPLAHEFGVAIAEPPPLLPGALPYQWLHFAPLPAAPQGRTSQRRSRVYTKLHVPSFPSLFKRCFVLASAYNKGAEQFAAYHQRHEVKPPSLRIRQKCQRHVPSCMWPITPKRR